jgi:hypothetical protein
MIPFVIRTEFSHGELFDSATRRLGDTGDTIEGYGAKEHQDAAAPRRPDAGRFRRGLLERTHALAAPKAVRTSGLCAVLLLGLLAASTAASLQYRIATGSRTGKSGQQA